MSLKKNSTNSPHREIEAAEKPLGLMQILNYDFIKELKSLPYIEKIFLFGSRSKGSSDDRSDIDLAIDCPTATDEQWDRVMKIIENSDTLLKIDCLRLDKIKNRKLLNSIMKNHHVVFEGKPKK